MMAAVNNPGPTIAEVKFVAMNVLASLNNRIQEHEAALEPVWNIHVCVNKLNFAGFQRRKGNGPL
jgi:predicted secreted protein